MFSLKHVSVRLADIGFVDVGVKSYESGQFVDFVFQLSYLASHYWRTGWYSCSFYFVFTPSILLSFFLLLLCWKAWTLVAYRRQGHPSRQLSSARSLLKTHRHLQLLVLVFKHIKRNIPYSLAFKLVWMVHQKLHSHVNSPISNPTSKDVVSPKNKFIS